MNRLLDPRLNAIVGALLAAGSLVWTVLTILLTSEPPNVIAMSGLALVLAGLQDDPEQPDDEEDPRWRSDVVPRPPAGLEQVQRHASAPRLLSLRL